MKKKAISMAMAVGAVASMAHAQSMDDFEQYKQDIKKKFEIAIKQQQSDFERFNRERTARFNDYVNHITPANNAKGNDSIKKQINREFAKQLQIKDNWVAAELMPAIKSPVVQSTDSTTYTSDDEYIEDAMPSLKPEKRKRIPYPVIKDSTDFKDGALYYKMMNNPELEKNTKLTPTQREEYRIFKQTVKDYRDAWEKRHSDGYLPMDAIIRAAKSSENN